MTQQDRLGAAGDQLYADLMAAHEGLSDAQSHRLNARLVLMLANALGDAAVFRQLLQDATEITEG